MSCLGYLATGSGLCRVEKWLLKFFKLYSSLINPTLILTPVKHPEKLTGFAEIWARVVSGIRLFY